MRENMLIFRRRVCCVVAVSLAMLYAPAAAAQAATPRIVSAANTFLSALSEKQRKKVLFAFDDAEQRQRWSNFPVSFVPRGGISLKEMSDSQRASALSLVSSALSKDGFTKVLQIMDADEEAKKEEAAHPKFGPHGPPPGQGPGDPNGFNRQGNPGSPNGPGGPHGPGGPGGPHGPGGADFGKDLYYISILGAPSEKAPWILQFGGHHLALNITIVGETGTLTPTLTAAQPARYVKDGKTIRPLGKESDKGLALLNSLDEGQRRQAILGADVADLVLGPGQDGKVIQPEGLKASAMNEKQRGMLLDLVSEWTGIIHESAAAARMTEIKGEVNDLWFLWSGPTTAVAGENITGYYRIQGPHLVIEYAPQRQEPAQHVHTMYRDPTNDYGQRLIKK